MADLPTKPAMGPAALLPTGQGLSGPADRRTAARHVNPWVTFAGRRLLGLIGVLVALACAAFGMVRLIPGDPARIVSGIEATQAQVMEVRHELGIDRPFIDQFGHYWGNLLTGDLGESFRSHQPVTTVISQRIGPSLQLAGAALVLVLVLGIVLGMLAGAYTQGDRHRRVELVFASTTSVVGSIPEYLAATFLAFLFAVVLNWFPVAGSDGFSSLVLPALAVALRPISLLARLVRLETLNVLAMEYVRTARSKRLPWTRLYLRHVLPNVVTAALTIGGVLFSGIIGGAVVVENVFSRPGLGSALVEAVIARDYLVIQGIILVLGITVVIINLVVDVLIAVLDPRSLTRSP